MDPSTPRGGGAVVLRGGSWNNNNPDNFRGARRNRNNPDNRNNNRGFRAASTPTNGVIHVAPQGAAAGIRVETVPRSVLARGPGSAPEPRPVVEDAAEHRMNGRLW